MAGKITKAETKALESNHDGAATDGLMGVDGC